MVNLRGEINFNHSGKSKSWKVPLLGTLISSEKFFYAVLESWFLVVIKRAEEQSRKGLYIFQGAKESIAP